MASIRAEAVAEVLWELKRLEKLATYSIVAERAGFKPGTEGKNITTCLEAIKRDWPHLQWWRAVQDDGRLNADSDQAQQLKANGYQLAAASGRKTIVEIVALETHIFSWIEPVTEATAVA